MPIIDLQRRLRQLGEIRLGHVVDTGRVSKKTGKPILRPEKLDKFRFTSPSSDLLEKVAALYGGEVRPWTPANGGPQEYELYSQANRLPVLVPPRDAVDQWYELYQGSKCVRRCDGQTERKTGRACMCDPDPARRDCAMTTRVNVMLRDVPALGQWLLISKGYYAAITLPDAAEVLALVGGYVPGWLGMEEKQVPREEGIARFMVPTLDVDITPSELMVGQIAGAGRQEVEAGPKRAAITAGAAVAGHRDYLVEMKEAPSYQAALALYKQADAEGRPKAYLEQLKAIGAAKRAAEQAKEQPKPPAPQPAAAQEPAAEVVEAEVVDDNDPTELWFQILAAAGGRGWDTPRTEQAFAEANGGLTVSSASPAQLRAFLEQMRGRR